MPRQAIIFDFDGIIIDSESVERDLYREIFAKHKVFFDEEAYLQTIGTNAEMVYHPNRALGEALGSPELGNQVIREVRERNFKESVRRGPLPGVVRTLETAKAMGIKQAIGSSGRRDWVVDCLTALDLLHYFDEIVTWNEHLRPKPTTDIFLHALKLLEVKPEDALVIEDSYNGVLSAHRAGIPVVAIPGPVTAHLDFSLACEVLPSMEALDLRKYFPQN